MELNIQPKQAPMDHQLSLSGANFPANTAVDLVVTTKDMMGQPWQSSLQVTTDNNGQFDLAKVTEHPMQMIWQMRPMVANAAQSSMYIPPAKAQKIQFTAKVADKVVAEDLISRLIRADGVSTKDVNQDNAKGRLFLPEGDGPHPGILLCAGSSGGILSQLHTASMLVSRGYVVFVAAYFNYEGMKKECYEIPLEIFADALTYLKQLPEVDANRTAMIAPSKGLKEF